MVSAAVTVSVLLFVVAVVSCVVCAASPHAVKTAESNKITAITSKYVNGALPYETNAEGKLFVKVVDDAKASYDALSEDVKELVSESSLEQLDKYIKAVEMANVYSQLSAVRKDTLTDTEKQDLQTVYNTVKAQIEEFRASEDYSSISALVGTNRLWYYQKAVSLFDAE